MKKRLFSLGALLVLLLSGCGVKELLPQETAPQEEVPQVETLQDWSFQYNDGTGDYSVFFALLDADDTPLAAETNVDVRIVNDENEEVYAGTLFVSKEDYGYYTSQAKGERYLAELRIPAEKIAPGRSSCGTVYLTVHKEEDGFWFNEVRCDALYCLPVKEIQVNFDPFPLTLKTSDYMGGTAAVLEIQGAEYQFDAGYSSNLLTVTILGEKIREYNTGYDLSYDKICYRLYDSAGYLVDSGNIYLRSLHKGDRFKDNSAVFYDLTPGETYTFTLSEARS